MEDHERRQPIEKVPLLSDENLIEVWKKSSITYPNRTVGFIDPIYGETLRPDTVPSIVRNEPRWREGLQNIRQHGLLIRLNLCLSSHGTRADFPFQFSNAINEADIVLLESFGWGERQREEGLEVVSGYMSEELWESDRYHGAVIHRLAQHRKRALMADIDDGTKTSVSTYLKEVSDMETMLRIGDAHPDDYELHRKMLFATYAYSRTIREWVMIAEVGKQLKDLALPESNRSLTLAHIVGSQHIGLLYKYRSLGVGRIDYLLARQGETLAEMRNSEKSLFDMAETGIISLDDLP